MQVSAAYWMRLGRPVIVTPSHNTSARYKNVFIMLQWW